MNLKTFLKRWLPTRWAKKVAIVMCGIIVGGGAFFLYALRMHTYLGDSPSACMNCHVMAPYYATWFHSSHARNTTCNDCHVPQDNFFKKWLFKGMDGSRHVAVFLTNTEPQVMRANKMSATVIMNNCIRCHDQLNTEIVNTGRIDYMMAQVGEGKACWDCLTEAAHGPSNSRSSTPNALVPYPVAPVPAWLQKMTKK